MPTLDPQAILDRVYRHFITDERPPGIRAGHIVYHQRDSQGNDRPCAIGIFDDQWQLDDSVFRNQQCPDVEDLFYEELTLLCEIFGVDRMTKEDMTFLQAIQTAHDDLAQKYEANPERFRLELIEALNALANRYELTPVAL